MKKIISLMLMSFLFLVITQSVEAKGPTYTIKPNSKTYNGNMMKYSTYNSNTKHYYLIRSYLERLEKTGGGTLVLEKGVYTITNVLYVPSNVTIKMKNGVVIVKGSKTGTNKMGASKSIFQLIRPSYAEKKGKVGGYNGERNISFIGEGKVKIDLNNHYESLAIIAGHNQNVLIENIEFHNMYSGHFLEVDASKNVLIKNNKFFNSKPSKEKIKEAINLDTPDRLTEGWSQIWSNFDKTANNNVVIEKNHFYNLDVAVGTHNYSEGKYHEKIILRNNTIDKMRTNGVRILNWRNSIVENNLIKNVEGKGNRGILASGAENVRIKNNRFENLDKAIQFVVWKNSGKASIYKITYNKLNDQNKKDLETNSIKNGAEGHISSNSVLNNYKIKTEEFSLKVISLYTKPKVLYASKPNAKAYKSNNKNSSVYKYYKAGEKLNLYSQGNDWYYSLIKDKNGNYIKYYFHEDEVQGTKPFIPEEMYTSKDIVKAYEKTNKNSKVLATYGKAKKINLEDLKNGWYFGYITYNGKTTKVYVNKEDLQKEKPFMPKESYVSNGGAKAYAEKSKESKVIEHYKVGFRLDLEYVGNNWYLGYITKEGNKLKVYFHEDEVQGSKPFIPEDLFVSSDIVNGYEKAQKNSKVLITYKKGQLLKLEKINKDWYIGYIKYNGTNKMIYIEAENVQKEKPFMPKLSYISYDGAKAYKEKSKESEVLKEYKKGDQIGIEHIGDNWYFGYLEDAEGKQKVYFHEDEVQGKNPN